MCRLTFIMEPTSFTNLVCGNIFVLSRNVVSLTSLKRLMKRPIVQELRRWPSQNHELHGVQQTTIKGGNAVMSNQPLQPKKQLLASSKSQEPKSKDKKKKKINTHIITFVAKLHKTPKQPTP